MMQWGLNITNMKFDVFLGVFLALYWKAFEHFESTFAPCRISESIFGYFLKLLFGLKYDVNIISSKNSDVKMMTTDLQAE